VNRRAVLGANDDVQFFLVDGAIAERRNLAGECHLHFASTLIAEECDGNIGDLKSTIIRSFRAPDELLSFLHRFLQGSSSWCDVKDGRRFE
jgi:hypothetical protein